MRRLLAFIIAVFVAAIGWVIGNQVWHGGSVGVASGTFTASILWGCVYTTVLGAVVRIIALNVLWPRR